MSDLDVLESVQQFRADVPEPHSGRVREARRSFHTALAEANSQSTRRRRLSWDSWRVRVPVMAGAGATLAAALAIGVIGIPGGGPAVDPAAAATLNAAADAAAAQPSVPAPADGQYWYKADVEYQDLSFVETDGGTLEGTSTTTYEIWLAPDASGRIVTTGRDARGDGDLDEIFGPGELAVGGDAAFGFDAVAALPRDVDALYAHIEQVTREKDNDRPVPEQMLVEVTDILRTMPPLPDLRESLYRVAARIPGVEVEEGVTDHLDRTGTAIVMDESDTGQRVEFLFDPETGEPLGERTVAPDGTVVYASAVTASGVVNSTDERP
jgi:RNA polymerase sigma-70 factor (ECF subfamily)